TLRSNPKAIHDLAKALDHLSRSARNDLDYERELEGQMRARIAAESEGRLKEAVKEKGLSAETAEIIRRKVLGLK
ncbi:MAG: phage protein Gp27 family protein, partial [Gluconacetobacter sp.]